jgi:hypothetical protein
MQQPQIHAISTLVLSLAMLSNVLPIYFKDGK